MSIYLILFLAWGAGLTAVLGGIIARFEGSADTEVKREFMHGITALGGGILLAAVAFALIPEGMRELNAWQLTSMFAAGGIVFGIADARIKRHKGDLPHFMAVVLDFVPEAISIGAIFTVDPDVGILLTFFIAVQNLPEGFNIFRELKAAKLSTRNTLFVLFGLSLMGPLAVLIGYFWLSGAPHIPAMIMSFAAGGILYLVFREIAPKAHMRRHWLPCLGAVFGFILGMLSRHLVG